jgi:hypothetical protein
MKSSAPMLKPTTSSISSSFEVRKIAGRLEVWRSFRSSSMPSIFGIFTSRMAMSGGRLRQAGQGGRAIVIGADLVAFGLEEGGQRSTMFSSSSTRAMVAICINLLAGVPPRCVAP